MGYSRFFQNYCRQSWNLLPSFDLRWKNLEVTACRGWPPHLSNFSSSFSQSTTHENFHELHCLSVSLTFYRLQSSSFISSGLHLSVSRSPSSLVADAWIGYSLGSSWVSCFFRVGPCDFK